MKATSYIQAYDAAVVVMGAWPGVCVNSARPTGGDPGPQ